MKVPSPTPLHQSPIAKPNLRRTDSGNQTTAAHNEASSNNATASEAAAERSFASVFDDTARPAEHKQEDQHDDLLNTNRFEMGSTSRAERKKESGRHDDQENDSRDNRHAGHFEGKVSGTAVAVREPARAGVAPNVRAILHIADLERIVAQVRTQTLVDRREVMISLHNSVLEGLRIKLSADKAGRVSAEFIAATEQMRSQLDARAPELSDLLRSRGVDLAELRTSVGNHASEGEAQDSPPQNFSAVELVQSVSRNEVDLTDDDAAAVRNLTTNNAAAIEADTTNTNYQA